MAASDIPVEVISDYLESLACKMVQGGIPAERVVGAVKLTALRVQALYSAPEPMKAPLDPPPDAPRFAAVLERLQAEGQADSPVHCKGRASVDGIGKSVRAAGCCPHVRAQENDD